jgi:hypothetical protein
MNEILRVVHLDDILIWGSTVEEHDERLIKVFDRLQKAGLTLNPDKCEYGKTHITFLGHILDEDGVHPDLSKIDAIVNLPRPKDVTEVRRRLGMTKFLGRFVPHLSGLCQSLHKLLQVDREFVWGATQELWFSRIKKILTSEPVLALFDVSKKSVVSVDSSSYRIGAVLLQREDNGELKTVSYTLSPAEQRNAQIEKEALASVWA